MADLAIRMEAGRLSIGFIRFSDFRGRTVLVLVMPEVALVLLMRAHARGRRPAPLDRQQHHQEDEDEATHVNEVYQRVR